MQHAVDQLFAEELFCYSELENLVYLSKFVFYFYYICMQADQNCINKMMRDFAFCLSTVDINIDPKVIYELFESAKLRMIFCLNSMKLMII